MQNLLFRAGNWYFNKRIPSRIQEYDNRKFVRFSLKTDSKSQAVKLATAENIKLENYWQALIETGKKHSDEHYQKVMQRSSLLGFQYQPVEQLANGPINELLERLAYASQHGFTEKKVEAVLGGAEQPVIQLDDALAKFFDLSKEIVLNKSAHQVIKWKNPRKLAMRNLISCVGNKNLHELTRDNLLSYKNWWITRIEKDNVSPGTANKHFIYLKTIIGTVVENYKIELDVKHLFRKLLFEYDYQPRLPLSSDQIINVVLNPINLKGMNDAHKNMLAVFSETGVSFSEQLGILPEDIFLNDAIPHIAIVPRKKNRLKTKYRKRIVPLIGFALAAFNRYPHGFTRHIKNADSATSAVNKYLRENDLLPSDKHSVYSLRHSFQDRLLAVNAPDRVQADLMGHKFHRPTYGDGATLFQKNEWLKKIVLKST